MPIYPGGSSAGSAAAVAARHVPIAIGSQTGGSVIRPASYCGTYGFKPSRGITSRVGFFQTSATLDQVGVFSNDLRDAALLSDVIGGVDQRDEASYDWPRPDMYAGVHQMRPSASFCWFDCPIMTNAIRTFCRQWNKSLICWEIMLIACLSHQNWQHCPRFIKSSTIMKSRETLIR